MRNARLWRSLLDKDGATDGPVQLDEVRVNRALRAHLLVANPSLGRAAEVGVTIRG